MTTITIDSDVFAQHIHSLIVVVVTAIASATFGWEAAHSTVATECGRLGAFYVGSKTFECKEKK